jgi:hypothetical protein
VAEKRDNNASAMSPAQRQKEDRLYAEIQAVGKNTDPFAPACLLQHKQILYAPAVFAERASGPEPTDQQRAALAYELLLAAAREYHEPVIADATLGLGAFAGKPITGENGRLVLLEKSGITKDIFESRRYSFYDHIVSRLRKRTPSTESGSHSEKAHTTRTADLSLQRGAPRMDYEELTSTFHLHALLDAVRRSRMNFPRDKTPVSLIAVKHGELFSIVGEVPGIQQALARDALTQVHYGCSDKEMQWSFLKAMGLSTIKDGSGHAQ